MGNDTKQSGRTEKTIDGGELGMMIVRCNPRALHYSLRIRNWHVIATIRQNGSERELLASIADRKARIVRMLQKSAKAQVWDESAEVQTFTFRVHIFRMACSSFHATLRDGVLHVACPETTDFNAGRTQQYLQKIFEQALRHEAGRTLPARLHELAARHGFRYTGVTVRNSRSRWGSCSLQKRISLSLWLMTLPGHLIEYVLLHELCHTVEMNHGKRFRQLMDRVTAGRATALRRELKAYQNV